MTNRVINGQRYITTTENGYMTIDICLDGMYDDIEFGVYYSAAHFDRNRKWFHAHDWVHGSVPSHEPAKLCRTCYYIHHIHDFQDDLIETWQVDVSPMMSHVYKIRTCSICEHRIVSNCCTYTHFDVDDTERAAIIELMERYLPKVTAPFPKRPYASGYSIELPAWVAYERSLGHHERVEAFLNLIRIEHHIPDVIFREVEGR